MTEIQSMIEAYRRAAEENVGAALATVVRVEGSAYRRPGARMLVTEDGRTTGVVSGGCLEGDVRGRAARVMRTGKTTLVRYDTTTDEDVVWGLGLGCNGVVDVLIEPANERADHLVRFLEACSNSQERAACATTIRAEGVADVALGSRVFLFPDGMVKADAGAPEYATLTQIILDLRKAVRSATSFVALYEGGNLEVFIEAVEPPVALIIFGAGADAVPLVTLAQRLGWLVTVVDTHVARTKSRAIRRCRCRRPVPTRGHRLPADVHRFDRRRGDDTQLFSRSRTSQGPSQQIASLRRLPGPEAPHGAVAVRAARRPRCTRDAAARPAARTGRYRYWR